MGTITNTQKQEISSSLRDTKTSQGTVAVVGLGYVGLPLALLAETQGYDVVGVDIDRDKVKRLGAREALFLNAHDAELLKKSAIHFGTDPKALRDADIVIICVPTPVHEDHSPDLGPLMHAARNVGENMVKGQLIIVESTVNPGVCGNVVLPILEEYSGLSPEKDFFFAHCPERINPGDGAWTTEKIPRVVGALSKESLSRTADFYRTIIDADVILMDSLKEAEAVKMVENSFRDINIAFVNELAMAFEKSGIDIMNVIRGASTKPFGFMPHTPGCGVGGHCIPVDPYYLIRYGEENGFHHRFLSVAREINNEMPYYTVDLLEQMLKSRGGALQGARITLLGLAYKADVPDMRESPAIAIRNELLRRGARLVIFDPYIPDQSSAHTFDEALNGQEAALIATDHTVFKHLTPRAFLSRGVEIVLDGRNCLPKETFQKAGILYRGIGR